MFKLNSTNFYLNVILILSSKFDCINRDDNCEEKIIIFWQYMRYYSIKNMHTYLYSIYNKKITNLIIIDIFMLIINFY